MDMRLYFMRTRSGLHCGVGQGVSDIDLPTARDSVTGHPVIPGSSIKGVLRDAFDDGSQRFLAAFGQESGVRSEFASALSFTDSRLVCLPVRSYFGTFAHLTSPAVLALLKDELQRADCTGLPPVPVFPSATDAYRAAVPQDSRLVSQSSFTDRLLLEELDLLKDNDMQDPAEQWAGIIAHALYPEDETARTMFCKGFAVVDDNVFDFFCETALPVAAHNRIGANGVVQDGALWYEEFVPAEAIFVGAVYGEDGRGAGNTGFSSKDLLDLVCGNSLDIQMGGNATTGRGLVTMYFYNCGGDSEE